MEWRTTESLRTESTDLPCFEQGLKVEHLLVLLSPHAEAGIPPSLVKALKRWETNGTEARLQTQVILKVSKPEVLEELRKSKAAKFLAEVLSPTR